ncbi:MAG: hypothetical protein QNJ73_15035 [Gammaproteobacteria bacterium]|nr:hypothetical protein [Gammaproteobacteria bacterium]
MPAKTDTAIAYRVTADVLRHERLTGNDRLVRLRTRTRALDGMQKEAVVEYGPTGAVWRLLCDEGPWLNGTDLAPFPLAFFTAGLAATIMSDFLAEAADRKIRIDQLELRQDNFFTMDGSAVKGTMAASVEPIRLVLTASGDTHAAELEDIAAIALEDRSATALSLREFLPSRFSIELNGKPLAWPGEIAEAVTTLADPADLFGRLPGDTTAASAEAIIHKDEAAPAPESEGAVGLQSNQKRMVHVHTEGRLRGDGLKEIAVQCIKPAGSRFVFLSDDAADIGGQERAPCGLTYLSAGVAFCFMTQLGRYAQIAKQDLRGYRIVQETSFAHGRPYQPAAMPVDTFVCLDSGNPDTDNLTLVQMGEQTCYLHAAFRNPVDIDFSVDAG